MHVINGIIQYHFHPPRQYDSLVVDGEQQRAVVFGIPQTWSHVTSDPFAVGHRRPAHGIESVHGHDAVERFVSGGQCPESQVVFAVRVQKSSTHAKY